MVIAFDKVPSSNNSPDVAVKKCVATIGFSNK